MCCSPLGKRPQPDTVIYAQLSSGLKCAQRGRSFRTIPSAVQSIENNVSFGNMDFSEFASAVDKDGVFVAFQGLDL
jgi:Domain of unknown function (DUF6924)